MVALLAEGVDRNTSMQEELKNAVRSPSSRRAWIEILSAGCRTCRCRCRPPRGGRG